MDATTAAGIDRLSADHDRVRATITGLEAFLAGEKPPADPAFARLRWQLRRELAAHLAVERHAYPAVRGRLRGEVLYRGIDHALDDDVAQHVAEWTAARIEAEWIAYRRAARLLLRRLRLRMAYEETVIFPMLAPAPSPRARMAAG